MLYKDRLGKVLDNANSKVRMPEVVHLKYFLVNNLQMNVRESLRNHTLRRVRKCNPEVNRFTIVTELKRSSKTIKPPQRYSPSLNYIMFIGKSEPKSYEEVVQVDESIK